MDERLPLEWKEMAVIDAVTAAMEALFESVDDDPAHSIGHVKEVTQLVVEAARHQSPWRRLALVLSALLHEADDDKIFKKTGGSENTIQVLREALPACDRKQEMVDLVIEVISLVSARANKNAQTAEDERWKLIVRDADRLEAVGEVGIARCYAYNSKAGMPLFTESTARPNSEEELWATVATPERFAAYDKSVSMVDHYFDKLLHVCVCSSGNAYLEERMQDKRKTMVDFVMNFARQGSLDIDYLDALRAKHCPQRKKRRVEPAPAPETPVACAG